MYESVGCFEIGSCLSGERDAWIGILTCVSFYLSNYIDVYGDE